MTNLEKMARRICWLGFTTPAGRKGKTEARYWKSLSETKRREYQREAEHFMWLYKNLPVEMCASDYFAHTPAPSVPCEGEGSRKHHGDV